MTNFSLADTAERDFAVSNPRPSDGNTPPPAAFRSDAMSSATGVRIGDPHFIGPVTQTVVANYTAILSGETWYGQGATNHPVILTYSFNDSAQPYLSASGFTNAFIASFHPLAEADRDLIRDALGQWGDASGIIFIEAPSGQGELQYGRFNFKEEPVMKGFDGYAFYPHVTLDTAGSSELALGGDVFFNNTSTINMYLALHETGHALGFKHPFVDDPTLDPSLDDTNHTVMSYDGPRVTELGPFDHQAVEHLYGDPDSDGTHVASWSWDAATATLRQNGGNAAETIRGVYGADIISGDGGNDLVFGAFGNDTLSGNAGIDTLDGGAGVDTASYAAAAGGVTVDLSLSGRQAVGGGDGSDTLISISRVVGSAFADHLSGANDANALFGGEGNDILSGRLGSDTLNGGNGIDRADYSGAAEAIVANLNSGVATGEGSDTFIGIENVTGSDAGNTLTGDANANVLVGGAGIDTLAGGAGADRLLSGVANDTLLGGADADFVSAGAGDDLVAGGAGADEILGGTGADTFRYAGVPDSGAKAYDAIDDFDASFDLFDVVPTIAAIDSSVSGAASFATLTGDLKSAVNKHVFGADHAVIFTADAGDLSGQIFLIVDLDSKAGFSSHDLLINLLAPHHLADLASANFT